LQSLAYIDTSAYLAVLFKENHYQEVLSKTKGLKLCTSSLMFLEAERSIVNFARQKSISQEVFEEAISRIKKDVEGFYIKELSLDMTMTMEYPAVTTPRSADLAHIRTALWFQKNMDLKIFITLDKNQQSASKEMGL
jgi:hypothetical protein